jgi:malate permease and related proteins
LNELLSQFLNNLLPIFLIAASGYLISKWLGVNPRSISQITFNIFSPCLVFVLITNNKLGNAQILEMMVYAAILIVGVGAITWLIGRAMRLERRLLIAVVIAAMFMNAGNFGLPLNLFAFGEFALAHASLFFVMSGIMTYSVGVVIASMGSNSLKKSLVGLYKIPAIYGVGFAFVFIQLDWSLPTPIDRSVTLLADAAIPSMLMMLGMQLQKAQWNGYLRALALAGTMRLLIAPLLAIGISLLFGMQGPARQAFVLESAMPTAVLTTILATEYDIEPAFITTAVLTTTLISPVTLTPLLVYLSG